ncbi:MAG TPA: DUF1573 domain-containing protein [Thermoanaerobaculia bacterium]|jgi:hypothetical protein|nr:DUF1573 domain-containing protein [Thermoanaerobaculia bacterium]
MHQRSRTFPIVSPLRPLAVAALAAGLALFAPPAPGQSAARAPAPAAEPGVAPPPRAIAAEPVWDAGIVAKGTQVVHEFTIKNTGSEMLQIREVRPACGCTVVSYDPAIPPGGEGKVRAEVDTGSFSGAIAKEVTVFTSDPGNAMIQLTIRAQVRAALDAQPGYFRFLHVVGAPPESGQQIVWSADFPELQVLSVTSPTPALTVTFRRATDAEREPQGRGNQWVIAATLAAEPPPGPLSGDVRVETNHPRKKVLEIPIAGYVRPVVMVTPPTADFGTFPGGQPRKGSVLITNYGSAPLQLLGVDSDVRGLVARIDEREKGKRFDLALTLSSDVARGPLRGALRVRTSSPKQPLLEVPVVGEVK